MKLGMRGHDFGRMSISELAESIKAAGFGCLQLAPTKAIEGIERFGDITPALIERIKDEFELKDLKIAVYGCYIEPSLEDETDRLAQVEYFVQGIKWAKILGAEIIGTETTHLDIASAPDVREAAYLRLKDSLIRMAKAAEKEGMDIGIEPVAEHVLNTPELALRLLSEVGSPCIKIIFDPVNLVLPSTIDRQREIYDSMFNFLGDKIAVVHMKDMVIQNGQKVWQKIGEGLIDYPYIFEWINKNKPDIPLLREIVRKDSCEQDRQAMIRLALS